VALRAAGPAPNETKWLTAIIDILHDPKADWEERGRGIDALVPEGEPLHYPEHVIDKALLKLLEPGQNVDSIDYVPAKACRALAARGRTEYFDRIVQHLKTTNDSSDYGWLVGALARLAQIDLSRFNPVLFALLKPELSKTNKSIPEIFWAIWSADARDAQPDLERLATYNPDEYEDEKASSSGGAVSDVRGSFHLARKIVSLWSERDVVTRGKLLIAFATTTLFECCVEPEPERLLRLKIEMNRVAERLSSGEHAALAKFLETIDSNPESVDPGHIHPDTVRKAVAFARKELGL